MNIGLKFVVVAVFACGMIVTVPAQNVPKTPAVRHPKVRHKSSGVSMPDGSKKSQSDLGKDLTRLEGQNSRPRRIVRRTPEKKTVAPVKTFDKQDRHANPPIDFSYKARSGNASHGGGASRGSSAPMKMGPRSR
jgi:hypothetical protein